MVKRRATQHICPTCSGTGYVFDAPLARSADPQTSQNAAARKSEGDKGRFSRNTHKGRLLELFMTDDATALEAAVDVVGIDASPSVLDGCRRRVSDLVEVGFLKDSNVRRRNAGSPDESVVWTITQLGQWAWRNLEEFGWTR